MASQTDFFRTNYALADTDTEENCFGINLSEQMQTQLLFAV